MSLFTRNDQTMLELPYDQAVMISHNQVEILDTRNYHLVAHDCNTFVRVVGEENGVPQYQHTTAWVEVLAFQPGEKPVDGGFQISAERIEGGVRLIFRKENWSDRMKVHVRVPRTSLALELWQCGQGDQLINEALAGAVEDIGQGIAIERDDEAIFYSVNDRNTLLFKFSTMGSLSIQKTKAVQPAVVGTPPWELNEITSSDHHTWQNAATSTVTLREWDAEWVSEAERGEVSLAVYLGHIAASRHYSGRASLQPVDVEDDFGNFFYQMFLGCLPLNLRKYDGWCVAPRCNVIISEASVYMNAWTRDVTWCYEYACLVDAQGISRLIEQYIALAYKYSVAAPSGASPILGRISHVQGEKVQDYWCDSAAELLIMGGRHFFITGDAAFALQYLNLYRRCGEFLLSLIPSENYLPVTTGTWDAQGATWGQEPYFTALCYTAFNRLASILDALQQNDEAARYRQAAQNMKAQANRVYTEGGFWHPERNTYINYIDFKDPACRSPRIQNWSHGKRIEKGKPRTEFAHYETIFPIWMGLFDDEERIRAAYRWIDIEYSYASGRGGVRLPPFVEQDCMALIDVAVRLKYGIPGADRLLQFILDRALDGGLPLTEFHFGNYRNCGPENPDWVIRLFRNTHTGSAWNNAPYFQIVMMLHYGLNYSSGGWTISDPKPVANYPLSQVGGLRHKEAVFNVQWQGQGTVHEIWVDSKLHPDNILAFEKGMHEVTVMLG